MKKVNINIPGFQIKSFDRNSGDVHLEEVPQDVTERIQSLDDVLSDHDLSQTDVTKWKKVLSDDEVAYRLIKLLCKSLNEGWEPDWSDSSQYKYYPWFEMGGSSGFRYDDCDAWFSNSAVGSRLAFKSKELAEYAGEKFTFLYKDFMIID